MKIIIDIPDESFEGLLGVVCRGRVARYLKRLSDELNMHPHGGDSSGTVTLDYLPECIAGWAMEGAPWQRTDSGVKSPDGEREVQQ